MKESRNHLRMIALLAVLEDPKGAKDLVPQISIGEQEELHQMIETLLQIPEGAREEKLQAEMRALRAAESFSGIAEIHPAWLVEALKRESPRVIGVILRHLPSKHVRYLLQHLPPRLVARLPKLIESFYVPTEILDLIRRRFENHFVPMRVSHRLEVFEFKHVYYLKSEDLETLFRDLGISELALSLLNAPRKMVQLILNRFPIPEAKSILSRWKAFQEERSPLAKEARYSVLDLEGREKGVEPFFRELGFQSFVKAFRPGDSFLFEAIKQKLSPESAYILKRYLEEQLSRFQLDLAQKRQEWILKHLRRLQTEGLLDPVWSESLKREAA